MPEKRRPPREKNKDPRVKKTYTSKRYTEQMLKEDREYGFYWYSWLWQFLRPILVFLCAAIICLGMVSTAWTMLYESFLMPPDADDTNKYPFEIASGESLNAISRHLEQQSMVRSGTVFKYLTQFTSSASNIRYGTYYLSPSMEVSEIISVLTSNVTNTERTIRIIPGWTIENIADYLVECGALRDRGEFLNLCTEPEKFTAFCYPLQDAYNTGALAGRKYALEGYLAPDTYRVFSTASAESILQKLIAQTNTVVDNVYYLNGAGELSDDEAALHNNDGTITTYDEEGNKITMQSDVEQAPERFKSPLTMDETLILASMIEREAGMVADYDKVSAVFHNRLQRDMALESDATISYILKSTKLNLTEEELKTRSPYNTYLYKGLPAGPICNPSAAAIKAALHPDEAFMAEGYLYFCAGNPEMKELVFAKTEEEHNANVAMYRQLWINFDEKQQQKNEATSATGDTAATP